MAVVKKIAAVARAASRKTCYKCGKFYIISVSRAVVQSLNNPREYPAKVKCPTLAGARLRIATEPLII